jgi:hypothetical protein
VGDCQVCYWWDLVHGIRVVKEFEMFWGFVGLTDGAVVERPREYILDMNKKICVAGSCSKMAFLHHT